MTFQKNRLKLSNLLVDLNEVQDEWWHPVRDVKEIDRWHLSMAVYHVKKARAFLEEIDESEKEGVSHV